MAGNGRLRILGLLAPRALGGSHVAVEGRCRTRRPRGHCSGGRRSPIFWAPSRLVNTPDGARSGAPAATLPLVVPSGLLGLQGRVLRRVRAAHRRRALGAWISILALLLRRASLAERYPVGLDGVDAAASPSIVRRSPRSSSSVGGRGRDRFLRRPAVIQLLQHRPAIRVAFNAGVSRSARRGAAPAARCGRPARRRLRPRRLVSRRRGGKVYYWVNTPS